MKNAIAILLLLLVPACAVAADTNKSPIPRGVQNAPFNEEKVKSSPVQDQRLIDLDDNVKWGDDEKGGKGLKVIDGFDNPIGFGIVGKLIEWTIGLLVFLLEVAFLALIAWIIIRAYNRKKDTGSAIPKAGDRTLFTIFDELTDKLKERRAQAAAELEEVNRRLPKDTK